MFESVVTVENLLTVCKRALADLEGIMLEFEPSGDRIHPAWRTIEELRGVLAAAEHAKVYLRDNGSDLHDEGCDCGLCNTVGKSYGVALVGVDTNENEDIVYGCSEEVAWQNAEFLAAEHGWEIVPDPEDAAL